MKDRYEEAGKLTTPRGRRMTTTVALLHERDFRAFLRGMQRYYPGPYWFRYFFGEFDFSKNATVKWAGETQSFEDIVGFMRKEMTLTDSLISIYFDVQSIDLGAREVLFGNQDSERDLVAHFQLPRYYTDNLGPRGKQAEVWTTLRYTAISTSHRQNDDQKRLFAGRVARTLGRVTTLEYDWRKPDERLQTNEWGGFKYHVGLAALDWLQSGKRRRLAFDPSPKPDWTFPEDHPWYQDAP